jgi:hypothetical protein
VGYIYLADGARWLGITMPASPAADSADRAIYANYPKLSLAGAQDAAIQLLLAKARSPDLPDEQFWI